MLRNNVNKTEGTKRCTEEKNNGIQLNPINAIFFHEALYKDLWDPRSYRGK